MQLTFTLASIILIT